MSLKNFNEPPACSAMPQPTAPQRICLELTEDVMDKETEIEQICTIFETFILQ
jgi:hypothetical protein